MRRRPSADLRASRCDGNVPRGQRSARSARSPRLPRARRGRGRRPDRALERCSLDRRARLHGSRGCAGSARLAHVGAGRQHARLGRGQGDDGSVSDFRPGRCGDARMARAISRAGRGASRCSHESSRVISGQPFRRLPRTKASRSRRCSATSTRSCSRE